MPGVFRAREVITKHGRYGHLRIFTFRVNRRTAPGDGYEDDNLVASWRVRV